VCSTTVCCQKYARSCSPYTCARQGCNHACHHLRQPTIQLLATNLLESATMMMLLVLMSMSQRLSQSLLQYITTGCRQCVSHNECLAQAGPQLPVQQQQHLHAEQRIASGDAQQHSDQLGIFRCVLSQSTSGFMLLNCPCQPFPVRPGQHCDNKAV